MCDVNMLQEQQAADILNVPYRYFIKLLNDNQIPFQEVKTHRYVHMSDLLLFKNKRDAERKKLLDKMTQDFWGYDDNNNSSVI